MKKKRLLAVLLAGSMCLGMGDMAFAEGGEIFSSGSEDMEGTEGLEYEYIEETDSCRVVKGVDQKQVDIPAYYEGKPL